MPDQPIAGQSFEDRFSDEHIDNIVLDFMLHGGGWPWTLDELARELGSQANADDAVGRLAGTGLVHRFGEFIIPTRSARRANEMQIGTI
jgi:hypothetical protein